MELSTHLNNAAVRIVRPNECSVVHEPMEPTCTGDEVLVEILATPVNPADRLELAGSYDGSRQLTLGAEGAGRVLKCGVAVLDLQAGALVLSLTRGNWQRYRKFRRSELLALPDALPVEQAAMLRVNPATAMLLLSDVCQLNPGDWVAFNAANSSVGNLLTSLATAMELRTIGVVRRAAAADGLLRMGLTSALIDDDTLPEQIARVTQGQGLTLALDCIGGQSTARLAQGVRPGGVVCVYGHLSSQDARIPTRRLTFGQIRVTGFNLGHALARRSAGEVHALYRTIAARMLRGELLSEVGRVFALSDVRLALEWSGHAAGSRVLLQPSLKSSRNDAHHETAT